MYHNVVKDMINFIIDIFEIKGELIYSIKQYYICK